MDKVVFNFVLTMFLLICPANFDTVLWFVYSFENGLLQAITAVDFEST